MYYSSFPYGFHPRLQAFMPVHPGYLAMPSPTPQNGRSPFPEVDTRKFNASATRFKEVMNQANRFINTLTASDDFAHRLMNAAQQSNHGEVEQLIRSTGVTITYNLKYTPDGIRIDFSNSDAENSCCTLRMALR
ncbi:hypothetical protein MKY41_03315 [Sporosarcina sp. FSL W7-1349]|uniref:hypothetical protein n=1 Tax=Sporosarcina sp. FSL W7-1349 TaxID=2921561 RepID=UPI0030F7D6C2